MLAVFGDEALLRAALDFEAELARAEAAEGLIPPQVAARIAQACETSPVSVETLAEEAAHAGTLAIPLVAHLRARLAEHDPEAAGALHRGATSQDVADTALMLQAKAGLALIDPGLERICEALGGLAERYAQTPMLGRTLLQPAQAITFGLKAIGWRLGVDEALARLRCEAGGALMLQLGGAAGTLAKLDGRGEAVSRRLADGLGLASPVAPWHARRGALAGLGCALAIAIGALAKIAQDVSLMAQGEVGEAFEPRIPGRGGSSAMAHKRNPTGCQVALSAQARAPYLAASLIGTLAEAHERGLGGWQAQAPVLVELFELTHGAIIALIPVVEALEVDEAAMRRNLGAAGIDPDVGESVAIVRRALKD